MSVSNLSGASVICIPRASSNGTAFQFERDKNKSMDNENKAIQIEGRALRIARLDADLYLFLSDPEPMIARLRNSPHRIDIFTFIQGLSETRPKYNYPMEWDNFAAVPISTFENWWDKQIGAKTRNKARMAEKKGISIREVPFDDQLVRGIWEIYNEVPVRQGRPFKHYGKDLDTVYKDTATYLDSSTFIGAFQGDELIGFIKLVADESGVQAGLMNILSKMAHRDKAPTNALLAQAVKSCADRGISYLVYANYAYGNKQSDSLTDFKDRNGFQRVDVPRYYVPLTLFGKLALRLGFHHKLIDRLPSSIASRIRELRKNWLSRKPRSLEEAT